MKKTRAIAIPLVALVALSACATVPTGPSVMALPGTGKNKRLPGEKQIPRSQ